MTPTPTVHRPLATEPVVLHVEDDSLNRRILETIARRRHLEIVLVAAETGTDGLRLAHERQPALILLDLDLPDIDGQEVLASLCEDPRTSQIPVVVVSGRSDPEMIEALLNAGADEYLTKPFDVDHMVDVLQLADSASPEE